MLFKIGLDVLTIKSEAVLWMLRQVYDKDQYEVQQFFRPPIQDAGSERTFYNRGLEMALHLRNTTRSGTKIFIGLTGGIMVHKDFPIRLDYMVIAGLLRRPFRGCLNQDFEQQLKHVKCSPSMAPESVNRFLEVVTCAIKLVD
jgi:hypothetical protein